MSRFSINAAAREKNDEWRFFGHIGAKNPANRTVNYTQPRIPVF
jgi:hypothetical protein